MKKPNEALNNQTAAPASIRSARMVARDLGISYVTLWRWEKRGLISMVNIAGRPYVTLDSLAEFNRRAARGDFAKEPSGCCRRTNPNND